MTSVRQEEIPYKRFIEAERILQHDENFENRAAYLVIAWRELRLCVSRTPINDVKDLLNWAKRHTLNVVLSGDWGKHKDKYEENLLNELQACEKLNTSFAVHCKKLAKVIIDPWGHPTLKRLLSVEDIDIGNEEFDFFMGESGYLISFRLKILCENHCEDLALNLVTAYTKCCKWAHAKNFNMNLTEDQKRFMLDVYISLLYKYSHTSVIVSTLKVLPLSEGLQFVKRFAKKRVDVSKLWKHSIRITHLAAVLFCSITVMETLEKSEGLLKSLLGIWLPLHDSEETLNQLVSSLRRIMQLAISASHMYIFCDAMTNMFGSKIKTFVVELYIQALTTDLNDLERQKNECNKEKEVETSNRLANGFMKLADILHGHLNVSSECVLTSYSLKPSVETLIKIEDIAREKGYEVLDTGQWKCKLHPPISRYDEVCVECEVCGDFMGKLELSAALNTNLTLNDALTSEQLGISSQLCDDLAVLLCSPRYQFLSWRQKWRDLHRLCALYLYSPERTKNYVTDLKFLDIDYSLFQKVKDEPLEEEEYSNLINNCEDLMAEEFKTDTHINKVHNDRKKPVRKKPNEYIDVFIPPKANSDPTVLKSLRSFRKALKRTSSDEIESNFNEKLFGNSSTYDNLAQNSVNVNNCTNVNMYENTLLDSINESTPFLEFNNVDHNFKPKRAHTISNNEPQQSNWQYHLSQNADPRFIQSTSSRQMNGTPNVFPYSPLSIPYSIKNPLDCNIAYDINLTNHLGNETDELNGNLKVNFLDECKLMSYSSNESKYDIMSKAVSEPTERVSCIEDKVPPWIEQDLNNHYLELDEIGFEHFKGFVQNTNFCDRVGSFSEKDDKGGFTQNTKESNYDDALNKNMKVKEVFKYATKTEDLHETKEITSINDYKQEYVSASNKHSSIVKKEEFLSNEKNHFDSSEDREDFLLYGMHDLSFDNDECITDEQEEELLKDDQEEPAVTESVTGLRDKDNGIDEIEFVISSNVETVYKAEPDMNLNMQDLVSLNKEDDLKSDVKESPEKYTRENFKWNQQAEPINDILVEAVNNEIDIAKIHEMSTNNIEEVGGDSKKQTNSIEDNMQHLKEKFQLKELRILLQRLDYIQHENKQIDNCRSETKYVSKKRKENKKKKSRKKRRYYTKVQKASLSKDAYKSSPLQDVNPRVLLKRVDSDKSDCCPKKNPINTKDLGKLIPRVVLKRLDIDKLKTFSINSLLNNVPGLHDTEMMRPSAVDNVVQVVQIAGGRSSATVQTPNNQTSTQVTPHIQRIGQPRIDKPESNTPDATTVTKSSTTTTNAKPSSAQPSTLINILSQQIIRPGQSANTRPPRPPYINILSQQIIRPANSTTSSKHSTNTTSAEASQLQTTSARIVTSSEHQIINQLVNPVRSTGTLKAVVGPPVSEQSRIVQFICKSTDGKLIPVTSIASSRVVKVATTQTVMSSSPVSPNFDDNFTKLVNTSPKSKSDNSSENSESLPKFQQAFGKTVYQNSVEATPVNSNLSNNINSSIDLEKAKVNIKNSTTLNVQPIQGGVIYTRQMPVGQAINLIPQSRVFRIAASNPEQISIAKDTVIQNKMSALLAAALQGKQKNSDASDIETNSETNSVPANTRVAVTARSTLVQNARIVKPVIQVPTNVIRNTQTGLSSTTLEQLREFDMVYKQVKERSSTSTTTESNVIPENNDNSPRVSVTYLNQGQKINCAPVVVVSSYNNLQPAASPALSVASQGSSSPCVTPAPTPTPVLPKVATKSSKGKSVKNTTLHTTKASPIPKPQQKPQEDEHTTQRIFDILAEYAEQLRNSPDLNNKPAPRRRSNPPTNPNQNSKRKKNSGSKKTGQCTNSAASDIDTEDPRTLGSEDSSCGVVQISMQEDEQTSATANASESNDSNVQPRQQLILTESTSNPTRNLIIADTSVGEALKMPNTAVLVPGNYIMPVSMVKGGQQIAVVSGGSKILATVPARSGPNMLLFQSFLNQNRKTNLSTVKYSTIQPLSGITSQTIAATAAQSPVILPSTPIGTVALGQPLTIKKIDDSERVNTELLLISRPQDNNTSTDDSQQPDSSTNIIQNNVDNVDLEENTTLSDNSSDKQYTFQKTLIATPIATPVIATCNKDDVPDDQTATAQTIMSINLSNIEQNKGDTVKVEERVQSVLVAAGTSNGPMLSHSPPHYNKQSECSESTTDQYKDDFLHNGGKRMNNEQKPVHTNNTYALHGKVKKVQMAPQKDREHLQHQQAALERELRFQKSLSEECEDLGVDEPSTSDLFPEADLLFDSNHSPSFDQSPQDHLKRPIQCQDAKEESKLVLFSDDDFLFEPNDYQTTETELEYEDHSHMITNGQSNTPEESVSTDNTLLQTCTSMSDVTLNSPISPSAFNSYTPPPIHKYIHKYTNRKKYDRAKQLEQWPVEVSSSEDTTGSTELNKSSSRSPDLCAKRNDDELEDGNFKVVQVSMSKSECENLHCNDTDCVLSGRGARRSVKKMCSCCNGSQETNVRKRPAAQSQTHYPHKKIFNKKR